MWDSLPPNSTRFARFISIFPISIKLLAVLVSGFSFITPNNLGLGVKYKYQLNRTDKTAGQKNRKNTNPLTQEYWTFLSSGNKSVTVFRIKVMRWTNSRGNFDTDSDIVFHNDSALKINLDRFFSTKSADSFPVNLFGSTSRESFKVYNDLISPQIVSFKYVLPTTFMYWSISLVESVFPLNITFAFSVLWMSWVTSSCMTCTSLFWAINIWSSYSFNMENKVFQNTNFEYPSLLREKALYKACIPSWFSIDNKSSIRLW